MTGPFGEGKLKPKTLGFRVQGLELSRFGNLLIKPRSIPVLNLKP